MIANNDQSRNRGLRFLLIAASLIIIVAGLRAAAQLILPFLISVFLAIISLPLMDWLQRKRVPPVLAFLCTIMAAIAVLAVMVLAVGGSVNEFGSVAPRYRFSLQAVPSSVVEWFQRLGIEVEWESFEYINPGAVLDLLGGTLAAVAGLLSNTFLVLLTMVFILLEAAGFSKKLQMAFGDRYEHLQRFELMTRQIQNYLAIKTLISLATGVLVGVWVAVLGLDFPLLWGLIAFFFNYIPTLGSILAAIPPILLAILQFGFGRALGVAIGCVAINIVLGNILEPWLLGRRLGLSTLVVFLSLVFWGWVWGPIGMLLSVPLTMVLKIALENTEDFHWVAVMLDANPSSGRFR